MSVFQTSKFPLGFPAQHFIFREFTCFQMSWFYDNMWLCVEIPQVSIFDPGLFWSFCSMRYLDIFILWLGTFWHVDSFREIKVLFLHGSNEQDFMLWCSSLWECCIFACKAGVAPSMESYLLSSVLPSSNVWPCSYYTVNYSNCTVKTE